MWHSLVALLQAQGQLPAVAFTFSRGRCDAHAAALGRTDLSSAAEKGRVRGFVRRCLARLRGGDRRLPQVGALGGCYGCQERLRLNYCRRRTILDQKN